MITASFLSSAAGLQHGVALTETKRLEDSVRAGGNDYLTALFQTTQGDSAFTLTSMAIELTKLPFPTPFQYIGKSIVWVTPALLAVSKRLSFVPEKIRHAATFLQEHLSTMYQVAALVSAVALIFFGNYCFGIAALISLGIGFADRNGLLPCAVRRFLHGYSPSLLMITSLFFGTPLDRIFGAINFIAWCEQASRTWRARFFQQKNPHETFALQQALDTTMARDFLRSPQALDIERKFVLYQPSPTVPNIDIQTLVERFNAIDWVRNSNVLRKKLGGDRRFTERYTISEQGDEQIIKIARDTLQTFVSTVKERRILQGEPADYEKLHNFLKVIAGRVQGQEAPDVTQTDILFRLAVEGGEYCGPGKFEAAESIFAQTTSENSEIPFEDKLLYCLQDERTRWMQGFYSLAFSNDSNLFLSLLGKVLDWQDIHNYNFFVTLYANELGLRKEAANNDDAALVDPSTALILRFTVIKAVKAFFWSSHGINEQTGILREAIGTQQLKKTDFYDFWCSWIGRQHIEPSEKEALEEELSEGRLFGEPIEDRSGKIKKTFIALMLLDLGIAKYRIHEHLQQPTREESVRLPALSGAAPSASF